MQIHELVEVGAIARTEDGIEDVYGATVEAEVILRKHVLVGTGSVILPGVVLEEGSVVGALSLVKKSTSSWSIVTKLRIAKIN